MFFQAELILALCLVWGWSCVVMPSDLCLLLLWLVLGLEMKGNGAGKVKAVVRPPWTPAYARVPYPMVCPPDHGKRRRCSHGQLPSRGTTQPWRVEREEVEHAFISLRGVGVSIQLDGGEAEQPS